MRVLLRCAVVPCSVLRVCVFDVRACARLRLVYRSCVGCAQFGGQEFEDNKDIVAFAAQNGPKSLHLFERGEINGDNAFLT